jgi:hypothetical protein
MNADPRLELFEALAELARRYPDWRLGQLVANIAGWADREVWDVEDEQLLEAAKLHLEAIVSQSHEVRA